MGSSADFGVGVGAGADRVRGSVGGRAHPTAAVIAAIAAIAAAHLAGPSLPVTRTGPWYRATTSRLRGRRRFRGNTGLAEARGLLVLRAAAAAAAAAGALAAAATGAVLMAAAGAAAAATALLALRVALARVIAAVLPAAVAGAALPARLVLEVLLHPLGALVGARLHLGERGLLAGVVELAALGVERERDRRAVLGVLRVRDLERRHRDGADPRVAALAALAVVHPARAVGVAVLPRRDARLDRLDRVLVRRRDRDRDRALLVVDGDLGRRRR